MTAWSTRQRSCAPAVALALVLSCDPETAKDDAGDAQTATRADTAAPASRAPREDAAAGAPLRDAPSCDELSRAMDCLKGKASEAERPSIEQDEQRILTRLAPLGPRAEQACDQGLQRQRAAVARAGCDEAGRARAAQRYPSDGIPPLAPECAEPKIVVATAPHSRGASYHWPWARQSLLAHPQYQVVAEHPEEPGQVSFEVIEAKQGWVLVGSCADAKTCNQLATMIQGIMRSSHPKLYCGEVPVPGARQPAQLRPADGTWLPGSGDLVGQCARLAACTIAGDPATEGDPGIECQRAPSQFRLSCAARGRCADVLACVRSAASR